MTENNAIKVVGGSPKPQLRVHVLKNEDPALAAARTALAVHGPAYLSPDGAYLNGGFSGRLSVSPNEAQIYGCTDKDKAAIQEIVRQSGGAYHAGVKTSKTNPHPGGHGYGATPADAMERACDNLVDNADSRVARARAALAEAERDAVKARRTVKAVTKIVAALRESEVIYD